MAAGSRRSVNAALPLRPGAERGSGRRGAARATATGAIATGTASGSTRRSDSAARRFRRLVALDELGGLVIIFVEPRPSTSSAHVQAIGDFGLLA